MKRKIYVVVISLLMVMFIFAGCTSPAESTPNGIKDTAPEISSSSTIALSTPPDDEAHIEPPRSLWFASWDAYYELLNAATLPSDALDIFCIKTTTI